MTALAVAAAHFIGRAPGFNLIFVHIPEERWKLGKRYSMVRRHRLEAAMLHWSSGLWRALSEPPTELCTRSDVSTA